MAIEGQRVWTNKEVDRVRELYEKGLSYGEIGDRFGVSRSAISGLINRHRKRGWVFARGAGAPKLTAVRLNTPKKFKLPVIAAVEPAKPSSKVPLQPETQAEFRSVEFMDLQLGECRYPEGDFHIVFCGQPRRFGSPYCERHHSMCYRKVEKRV